MHYYMTRFDFAPDTLSDIEEMVDALNAGEHLAPPEMLEGLDWIHIGEYKPRSIVQADIYGHDKNGLLELIARTTFPVRVLDIKVARSIKQQLPQAREVITKCV